MHTIITIGRSFGSAGGHIGHAIGKKLGIPFYDNALISQAAEEEGYSKSLFAHAEEKSLLEMIDSEELIPVLAAMQEGVGLSMEKTKQVFLTVALFAHGYASIIANNGLEYDEDLIAGHLERAWNGAFLAAAKEESKDEETV